MKLPLALTIIIVAVGAFWIVREKQSQTDLREEHRQALDKSAASGIPEDSSPRHLPTRAAARPSEDKSAEAREMAASHAASYKGILESGTSDNDADEKMNHLVNQLVKDVLSLNRDEFKVFIAELRARSDMNDKTGKELVAMSIEVFAQKDPEAALSLYAEAPDLLDGNEMSKALLISALALLAKDQPLAALEWIKKNAEKHPELVTADTKGAVIAGAARTDFTLALQLIGELKLESQEVMGKIAQAAATPERQTELIKALRHAAANSSDKEAGEKLLSGGLQNLFPQVAQTGFESAMKFMDAAHLSATETSIMTEQLNYHQTKADTGKWLDWLATQTTPASKSQNVTTNLVRNWTEQDYKAAGAWLVQAPAGPAKESATLSYLKAVAPYEPGIAAQWAATLPLEKQKDALRDIHEVIGRNDKDAARDFATRHGIDGR